MQQVLVPLEPPYAKGVSQALASYPQRDGYLLKLFRTFANSERFLRKGVANLLDKESPIDLRTREIVILRTTANRGCEYEWGVHVAIFAQAARFTDAQVRATRFANGHCWTVAEQELIAVVDQLCASGTLEDGCLKQFQSHWSCAQQLEILALIGTYSTISFVANVARLPAESFAAKFPPLS